MPQFCNLIKNLLQVKFINICTFYLHVKALFDYDQTFLVKKRTAKVWQRTIQVKRYEIVRPLLCSRDSTPSRSGRIFFRNTGSAEEGGSSGGWPCGDGALGPGHAGDVPRVQPHALLRVPAASGAGCWPALQTGAVPGDAREAPAPAGLTLGERVRTRAGGRPTVARGPPLCAALGQTAAWAGPAPASPPGRPQCHDLPPDSVAQRGDSGAPSGRDTGVRAPWAPAALPRPGRQLGRVGRTCRACHGSHVPLETSWPGPVPRSGGQTKSRSTP